MLTLGPQINQANDDVSLSSQKQTKRLKNMNKAKVFDHRFVNSLLEKEIEKCDHAK